MGKYSETEVRQAAALSGIAPPASAPAPAPELTRPSSAPVYPVSAVEGPQREADRAWSAAELDPPWAGVAPEAPAPAPSTIPASLLCENCGAVPIAVVVAWVEVQQCDRLCGACYLAAAVAVVQGIAEQADELAPAPPEAEMERVQDWGEPAPEEVLA